MDIKGKRLSVEEIGKLENGTKVWIENIYTNSNGIFTVNAYTQKLVDETTLNRYTYDYKNIQVYEWLEDMVEIGEDDFLNLGDEIEVNTICCEGSLVKRMVKDLKIRLNVLNRYNKYYIKREDMKTMEKQFTKADFKSGMVVEVNGVTGSVYTMMVIGENLVSPETQCELCGFDKELKSEYLSIDKVFNVLDGYEALKFMNNEMSEIKLTLIWERKEEPQVDWSKVEKDTLIEFVGSDGNWYKRYFAKFDNDTVYFYINGATSITSEGETSNKYKDKVRLYK